MAHLLTTFSMFAGFGHGVALLAILKDGRWPNGDLQLLLPGVAVFVVLNWLTYRGKRRRAAGESFANAHGLAFVTAGAYVVGACVPFAAVVT